MKGDDSSGQGNLRIHKIIIIAEYLPGKLNVRADWSSRNFQDFSEWLLSPKMFQMINENSDTPEIVLLPPELGINFTPIWLGDHIFTVRQDTLYDRNGKPGTSICCPPFLTDKKSSLRIQRCGINHDFGNSNLACTTFEQSNSRPVYNRTSTAVPISGTFGRSQGTSTSSV